MPAPKTTRRDKAFSEVTIAACLPGTTADIARRSGFSPQTVGRVIRRLLAQGKAHQTGWEQALRWWPVYGPGPVPDGFVLPSKPDAHKLHLLRNAKYKKRRSKEDPTYRAKETARKLRYRAKRALRDPGYIEHQKAMKKERDKRRYDRIKAQKQSTFIPKTVWVGGNPFERNSND